ncbi:MAG: gliding motility protein GldM [Flavobacteriales bacterium]|nr:gliding motility protein GldM [Flavobacteriales bacterium]
MAGGKETPRQKMIGMMYLVLTALLALNVSKDILEAFVVVNDGIELTNIGFHNKTEMAYASFDRAKSNNPDKVTPYWNKAYEAKKYAQEMLTYLDSTKVLMKMKVDQIPREVADTLTLEYMQKKDDYDTPTRLMCGEKVDGRGARASELKAKLEEFKSRMEELLPAESKGAVKIHIDTEDKSDKDIDSWENENFYHTVAAGSLTILSKLESDVMNVEADIVNELFRQVDASDFKFDTLAAKIIAPNLVFQGDEYKAEIFVAAFSTTQNPDVYLGKVDTTKDEIVGPIDSTSVVVDRGVGVYTVKASGEGVQKYSGVIRVKAPSGAFINRPFEGEYMVMKSGVVVSPTKMNVLYRGVKNPISISVPGVAPELVKPSLSGGTLSPDRKEGKGNYIAEVKGGSEAIVKVSAEIGGKVRPMGDFKFRVKDVPPPVATIAGVEEGLVSANRLAAAPTVIPKMQNFDFELFFQVTKFDLVYQVGTDLITKPVTGSRIPDGDLDQIKRLKKGSRVYIENISAVMLDENNRPAAGVTPKKLSPVSLKLN